MRAVKNVVNTERTVVCAIHQSSIDIFETFHELILLKVEERIIYSGPMGQCQVRWLNILRNVKELVKQLSTSPPGSRDMHFPTLLMLRGNVISPGTWKGLQRCTHLGLLKYSDQLDS